LKRLLLLAATIILSWGLIFSASPVLAAKNPTRGDVPKLEIPKEKFEKQTLLLLPGKLIIYNFTINNVTYNTGSTLENASGKGTASFGNASAAFTVPFKKVRIQALNTGGANGTTGRIVEGQILINFNPTIQVTLGTMTGSVSRLFLSAAGGPSQEKTETQESKTAKSPLTSIGSGVNQVDLKVLLPTLWTRDKKLGSATEYLPARQAYLRLTALDTTQDLDIYLTDYTDHQLKEVGIGDTNIIMDCATKPLLIDLSSTRPVNNPSLTGVGFLKIGTLVQTERLNGNSGFCYGEYLMNGALNQNGLFAKLTLQKNLTYRTSLPLGYQVTLDSGLTEGLTVNQNAGNTGGLSINQNLGTVPSSSAAESAGQSQITNLLQGDTSGLVQSTLIDLSDTGSDFGSDSEMHLQPNNVGTLILAKSAVLSGKFVAKITLPSAVENDNGDRVIGKVAVFLVNANLSSGGKATFQQPLLWGKCDNNSKNAYMIQTNRPAWCFFPGTDAAKPDFTTGTGIQESFKTPAQLVKIPGVTFFRFNLTVKTKDANDQEIYFPFETLSQSQSEAIYRPSGGDFKNLWLNVGSSGMNGMIQVDTRLAYDATTPQMPTFSVGLGNKDPHDNPMIGTANYQYQAFQGFFHSNAYLQNFEADGQPVAADKVKTVRNWGKFFQAAFIDNAVFYLGIDGHIQVAGPAALHALIDNLSATSTAELCGANVSIDAQLDYWGVDLDTKHSKLTPRVAEVVFLGASVAETGHYKYPFPVVWGEMLADGNIPELLFGYTYQTFDLLPYAYRNVGLSKYAIPDNANGVRGALVTEGDVFFAYFDPQQMEIDDYNDCTPGLDSKYEGRKIKIKTKSADGGDYFSVAKSWGAVKSNKSGGNQSKVTFNFPHVTYFDGSDSEDGFAQLIDSGIAAGTMQLQDVAESIAGNLHITGLGSAISIPEVPDAVEGIYHMVIEGEVSDTLLKQIYTLNPINFTSDYLSNFNLLGDFAEGSMLGGIDQSYLMNILPDLSEYEVYNPSNLQSFDFALQVGTLTIKGKSTMSVTMKDGLISGNMIFDEVTISAPPLGGHGSGGFGVTVGKGVQYIQGYGTITINGIPWPAPNSGGGALFLGRGAKPADVYALDYLDRGALGSLPETIDGFYIACKMGYDYSLAGLGEAYVYIAGGIGYFDPTILIQTGLNVGVEVCGIGLDSSAYIAGSAPISNVTDISLQGVLRYHLSLWFVDFDWSGSVTLKDGGMST